MWSVAGISAKQNGGRTAGTDRRFERRQYRAWNRNAWRNNARYNWRNHRRYNSNIFSVGRYYAPYRGYNYRRFNVGFQLGNLFFGSRYWINDPWRYRLPAVYGDYRWIRYYDDVVLVNTYNGRVVDVIYDFFY